MTPDPCRDPSSRRNEKQVITLVYFENEKQVVVAEKYYVGHTKPGRRCARAVGQSLLLVLRSRHVATARASFTPAPSSWGCSDSHRRSATSCGAKPDRPPLVNRWKGS